MMLMGERRICHRFPALMHAIIPVSAGKGSRQCVCVSVGLGAALRLRCAPLVM